MMQSLSGVVQGDVSAQAICAQGEVDNSSLIAGPSSEEVVLTWRVCRTTSSPKRLANSI